MHRSFVILIVIGIILCRTEMGFAAESFVEPPPVRALRVPAATIQHTVLDPVAIIPREGIGSDEAASIAVTLSPALRATRARRGLAGAQLIEAGILPNPQVSYTREVVTGGNTVDTVPAFTFAAGWEVTSLLPLLPKRAGARANARSVDLDIAWEEWQAAQMARLAVYRVVALEAQLGRAREGDRALQENVNTLKKAVEVHEKTVLDLAAAQTTSEDAHATALSLEQDFDKQQLVLKKALGLPPDAEVRLRADVRLPSKITVPPEAELVAGLETHRLDLVALQLGMESQDAAVRASILAQFPKISLGFTKASDTSNVHTEGFSITVDVPIFDRNQAVLATARATRQRLRDEYGNRVFEARSDIATALADIRSLNRQIAAAEAAVPLLENLVETTKIATAERNADVLSYYDARNDLLQKRIQVFKLKQQLLEARTALEIASGRYLPSALSK